MQRKIVMHHTVVASLAPLYDGKVHGYTYLKYISYVVADDVIWEVARTRHSEKKSGPVYPSLWEQ